MSDEPEKTQILTQQPETISTAGDEFDRTSIASSDSTSESAETPTEIDSEADVLTEISTTSELAETPMEIASLEDISTAIIEPETIPISTDIVPETSQTASESPLITQTASPEPKKTRIWQILAVFLSGMLVGSVLSLGTLLAWRIYQERANIQIRLPADVPLSQSPSPIAAAPVNQLPAIPPAPGTVPQPPASAPSPNPTAIPSLSGVTQLPSPSSSPQSSAAASPAPETAVTERVSFAAGATGTTLSNSLPANKSKRYSIDCNSGQSMTVQVQESGVTATIIAPNGEKIGTANSTSQWQGQLPIKGDYTIEISGDDRSNYTVKIDVL